MGKWDTVEENERGDRPVTILVETDKRSRVVIPGHSNQRFIVRENSDGSILLQPAIVVAEAQAEYDESPELQDLLTRAAGSKSVQRSRRRRLA
jgi:hypothetical protein